MTWPTVAVTTTNTDAGTDSPATARTDILDLMTKSNQMIAHVSSFAATVLDDTSASAARATLGAAASGANTDITSLAGPALGAATATTPAVGDNDTSVATTAFVNAKISSDVGVANSALVKTAVNAGGSAGIYAVRAWCVFNGTTAGTNAPIAGGGVTSVTRNSTGNYTINLSTALSDVNFSVTACSSGASGHYEMGTRTTSTVQIQVINTVWAAVDSALISVQITR